MYTNYSASSTGTPSTSKHTCFIPVLRGPFTPGRAWYAFHTTPLSSVTYELCPVPYSPGVHRDVSNGNCFFTQAFGSIGSLSFLSVSSPTTYVASIAAA